MTRHPIPINPSWVSHYTTTAESQLLQMWPTKPGIVCLLKRGTSKTRSSAQKCWKWPCVVLGKQVQLGFLELTMRKQFLKACCLWSTQTFISVSAQKFQLCILWCVKFKNIRKLKKVLLGHANFSNQLTAVKTSNTPIIKEWFWQYTS